MLRRGRIYRHIFVCPSMFAIIFYYFFRFINSCFFFVVVFLCRLIIYLNPLNLKLIIESSIYIAVNFRFIHSFVGLVQFLWYINQWVIIVILVKEIIIITNDYHTIIVILTCLCVWLRSY